MKLINAYKKGKINEEITWRFHLIVKIIINVNIVSMFCVLNFIDKWEVYGATDTNWYQYVSVDDKMSVVIAFEKLKNTSREGCPLGSNFCGYVVQFSLILCF